MLLIFKREEVFLVFEGGEKARIFLAVGEKRGVRERKAAEKKKSKKKKIKKKE